MCLLRVSSLWSSASLALLWYIQQLTARCVAAGAGLYSGGLNRTAENQVSLPPVLFSSSPGWFRLHRWLAGWKTLRASYSLNVNSRVTQLLNMRECRESGSQKSYQKHSSAFTRFVWSISSIKVLHYCVQVAKNIAECHQSNAPPFVDFIFSKI